MTSLSSQEKASAYLSATKRRAAVSRFKFRLLKCLSYPQDNETAGRQCAASSSAFGIVIVQLKLLNGGITQSNKTDKRSQQNAVTAFSLSKKRLLLKPHSEIYRQYRLKHFSYLQGINSFVSASVQLL